MPASPVITKGETVSHNCNGILCVKWHDDQLEHMLSSVHEDKMIDSERPSRPRVIVKKPACVIKYNQKKKKLIN